jgi:hypothetical protein
MRLSDFIQDTLYEIALGVQLAQARAKDLVAIAPSRIDGVLLEEKSYVDFDVSVVVTDSNSGAKGGGVKLGSEIKVASFVRISADINGSAGSKQENTSAQTHRVAFKVPVYMNASFKDNPATAIHAEALLNAHRSV